MGSVWCSFFFFFFFSSVEGRTVSLSDMVCGVSRAVGAGGGEEGAGGGGDGDGDGDGDTHIGR